MRVFAIIVLIIVVAGAVWYYAGMPGYPPTASTTPAATTPAAITPATAPAVPAPATPGTP